MTDNKLNTLEKWVIANLDKDDLNDITVHGVINGGYKDLVYLNDTTKIYDKYHNCIWILLKEYADNAGCSVTETINNFNNSNDIFDEQTFKHKLVLFAVESIAHRITEQDGVM